MTQPTTRSWCPTPCVRGVCGKTDTPDGCEKCGECRLTCHGPLPTSPTRPYRVLVTGSRSWNNHATIHGALADLPADHPLVIVHGACPTGADAIASTWARARQHLGDPVTEERHPAKGHPTQDFGPWPAAGPRRNRHMVTLGADVCLAFIGPCTSTRCRRPEPHPSHGATGCADLAEKADIPTRRWTT